MDTKLLLFILGAFVGVTLVIAAIGFILRDLIFGRRGEGDSDAELDAIAAEIPDHLLHPRAHGVLDLALTRLLAQAGSPLTPEAGALVVVAFALIGGGIPYIATENLLAAAAGMLIGGIVPFLGWAFRRWRRQRAMRKRLPESLDIVADVIRAGRTLEQAAEQVAADVGGPLGQEFGMAASQLRLGHAAPAVVDQMVRRVALPEFRIFAMAVLVHRKSGGNLAGLTERLARAARDRQEFTGHLGAVTAGSRLSAIGLLIGSVVAVVALGALQPNYYGKFFAHPWGVSLAAFAGGLQVIGIAWVYRILKVNF